MTPIPQSYPSQRIVPEEESAKTNVKPMNPPEPTSWEKEFDKRFGEYGTYSSENLDALISNVDFRLKIKDFIKETRTQAVEEGRRQMAKQALDLFEKEAPEEMEFEELAQITKKMISLLTKEQTTDIESWGKESHRFPNES